ncbi:MAG TPA: GAF and ANTAR domain-containing protein [Actinopolymorphaceae bacterium]|jgi:hypothetical protein
MSGGSQLGRAFVQLTDTLGDTFDVEAQLRLLAVSCVRFAGADAAGVFLSSGTWWQKSPHRSRKAAEQSLELVASSNDQKELIKLLQIQTAQGPARRAYDTEAVVINGDLRRAHPLWPQFADAAARAGFRSVQAHPMRVHAYTVGAVCLLREDPGALDADHATIAESLTAVATTALLQDRLLREQTKLAEQLQIALNSRILIEQAKGALAVRRNLSIDQAFAEMRAFARSNNRRLTDVAAAIVEDLPSVAAIAHPHHGGPRVRRSPSSSCSTATATGRRNAGA